MRVGIIGAGATGWAAALNLSELHGIDVVVFHGGVEEEGGVKEDPSERAFNVKLLRGSDFPYRHFYHGPKTYESDVHVPRSFSKEGLSLVWGATMLPYTQSDIEEWPISTYVLEPGYSFISERMPIAGRVDRLAEVFTPFISQPVLQPTNRILKLLEIADGISESNVTVGSSRLAVFNSTRKERGCLYCDLCLQGCPYQKIWAAPSVDSLNVKYLKNLRVIKIQELDGKVLLDAVNQGGEALKFEGFDKVFLAAGNVESFRILAASGYVAKSVTLQDSATFYFPLLLYRGYKGV